MSVTITDLFCGAGGSSLGAAAAGGELVIAANHWQTAIDVHQANFPDARHDCADISQADPRRYPATRILLASPECTNHSQARSVSRRQQDPSLWDAPDPAAERSRATMWDVVRFAEQIPYDAIVVENVVEATQWKLWPAWRSAMEALGYTLTLLSHNSMHHGVPQSRDRIYCVWLRRGIRADLELEVDGRCPRCAATRRARQAWKNGRTVGRYRSQWIWVCTTCGAECATVAEPAAKIIDWSLPCPRIGDRTRPLATATRARILAGMQRYGWAPITTSGAGNVHERTPGNRARPLTEPLPTQQTTSTSAIATPPAAFLHHMAYGGRTRSLDQPTPTITAHDRELSLVVSLRNHGDALGVDQPVPTVAASGNHHALVVTNNPNNVARTADQPLAAVTTSVDRHALLVRSFGNEGGDPGRMATPVEEPARTFTGTKTQGLLMRNNGGGAEMVTPLDEPARTMTTKGHQSLLVPYNGQGHAREATEPIGTVTGSDRWSLADLEQLVDDCGFRMLEPYEVAAAMAFPAGYIPLDLSKKDQVKLAGNAVTPPVMTWIVGRVIQALEVAA